MSSVLPPTFQRMVDAVADGEAIISKFDVELAWDGRSMRRATLTIETIRPPEKPAAKKRRPPKQSAKKRR
jgi:hypothetical protein